MDREKKTQTKWIEIYQSQSTDVTFEWITKWLTAAQNETVAWAEFARVRMLLKGAQ